VLLLMVTCVSLISAKSSSGDRILVLYDADTPVQNTHSIFFEDLRARGYTITFKDAADNNLSLETFGEWLYDHIVVFSAAASSFGGSVEKGALVDWLDQGRNLLVAASTRIEEAVQLLAHETGVYFASKKSFVVDHVHHDNADEGDHTLIVSSAFAKNANIILPHTSEYGAILFRGIAQKLDNEENSLLYPLVNAAGSAYSAANVHDKLVDARNAPHSVGSQTALLSAFQGRNNGRAVFCGSLEFFSDKLFQSAVQSADGSSKHARSGNRQLAADVSAWAFKESGVLRTGHPLHHLRGQTTPPKYYRINDSLEYSVRIEQWNPKKADWEPFKASDVQLEFVRLDPHVRLNLKHDSKGLYHARFTVPDVYGIFTFKVEYERLGYTFLRLRDQAPVRPYRHDEYERFIVAAYPYYAGALSMLAGVVVFSLVFLFSGDPKDKRE